MRPILTCFLARELGLRLRKKLLRLRWRDLGDERGVVVVHRGKGGRHREVPLRASAHSAAREAAPNARLFTVLARSEERWQRRAAEEAGIKPHGVHRGQRKGAKVVERIFSGWC